MLTSPFLTDLDTRAAVKGPRDPLGDWANIKAVLSIGGRPASRGGRAGRRGTERPAPPSGTKLEPVLIPITPAKIDD